jgi:hypothetical protein
MSRSAAQLSSSLFKRFPALVGEMRSVASLGKEKGDRRRLAGERTTEWDVVIAQTRTAICSWARQVLLGRWLN